MYDILTVYLENGLRVIMHRIPYIRTMACGLWVRQGSKYEDDNTNGLSHLVEHLMINTENDKNLVFRELMGEITSNGIVYNASTTKETTSYYFTGLSNMIGICIKALANIAISNRSFSTELIENEKKVVTQEAISFYSSFNQIKERTGQALWGNIGVGRIIVGDIENIKNAKVEDLYKVINDSYTPENSTIVVIGNVDYEKTLELIEENFIIWEDANTREYKESIDSETGIYFNQGSQGRSAVVSIGFRTPSHIDKNRVNIEIISKILGDTTLGSRLVQEIRMKRGLAYNLGSFSRFYENRGIVGFTAVCAKESINEVLKIMINELNKAKKEGFDEDEINRAKKSLETRTLIDLDNLISQLTFLGKYACNGQIFSLEQEVRVINKVRSDSLYKNINDIFTEDNMALAVIGECDIDNLIPLLKID